MTRLAALTLLVALLTGPPASATLITVTADDCATIVAYTPSGDVAYQPGVDVDGNAVAPADLDDYGRLDLDGDDVVIDIDIPLSAVAGVVGDEAAFTANGGQIDSFGANASVGTVSFRGGDVYFNGQRISNRQREAIAVACAELQQR